MILKKIITNGRLNLNFLVYIKIKFYKEFLYGKNNNFKKNMLYYI